VIVVRYADDLVVGFEHRAEAVRFLEECRERLSKFGLELNSEKTRLIEFGRFAAQNRRQRGEGKPETFTFLGFTHYCGKRRDGAFTAKKRMAAKLKAIKLERRRRKHVPIAQVCDWLRKVTPGYYLCHAVPGNLNRLTIFRHRLARLWRLVLQQRSQRGRLSWERMHQLLARWIPVRRAMHPYPRDRFDANHPRWKPYSWTPRRMGVPPCS
jgi:RNA-directed DNA polymerase